MEFRKIVRYLFVANKNLLTCLLASLSACLLACLRACLLACQFSVFSLQPPENPPPHNLCLIFYWFFYHILTIRPYISSTTTSSGYTKTNVHVKILKFTIILYTDIIIPNMIQTGWPSKMDNTGNNNSIFNKKNCPECSKIWYGIFQHPNCSYNHPTISTINPFLYTSTILPIVYFSHDLPVLHSYFFIKLS